MKAHSSLRIRHATLSDYESVEALWLDLNRYHADVESGVIRTVDEYMPPTEYQRVLDDPNATILLVSDDSHVLGAAWLMQRTHQGAQAVPMQVAFVQEFCIREDRRRRGLGAKLMRAVEQWARERALARIEFNVWARNSGAISFYQALGFDFARHEMYKPVD